MTTIRLIHFPGPDGKRCVPDSPVTDQHPQAVRYPFDHPALGLLNVDALGGAPTQADVDAHLGLDAAGQAVKARVVADADDAAACKQDPAVAGFLNMKPGEVDAWIDTNIGAAATWEVAKPFVVTALKVLAKLALTAARGWNLRK